MGSHPSRGAVDHAPSPPFCAGLSFKWGLVPAAPRWTSRLVRGGPAGAAAPVCGGGALSWAGAAAPRCRRLQGGPMEVGSHPSRAAVDHAPSKPSGSGVVVNGVSSQPRRGGPCAVFDVRRRVSSQMGSHPSRAEVDHAPSAPLWLGCRLNGAPSQPRRGGPSAVCAFLCRAQSHMGSRPRRVAVELTGWGQ